MTNAGWSFGLIEDDESPGGFLPSTVQAAADPDRQSVRLNARGGFFVPVQTIVTETFGSLTVDFFGEIRGLVPNSSDDDIRAFIILHETAHLTGVLGPDRQNKSLSEEFNSRIAKNCFK